MLISIHIPRVGDDGAHWSESKHGYLISIHIPRVGDDRANQQAALMQQLFQSTSPVWGMTVISDSLGDRIMISIHIPRVGDDHSIQLHFHPI